jgi:translocation and assembly module TamB
MDRRERRAAARALRRALKVSAAIVGVVVTFAGSAAVGLVLHLGTPPARRVAIRAVNGILAGSFKGSLTIEQVDGLGLGGAHGVRFTVRDALGEPVLHADGVRADVSVPSIVRSVVLGRGNILIKVAHARVDHADVALEQDDDGALSLERSFEPKTPSVKPPDPKARGVEVSLSDVRIEHAWVHGRVNGSAIPIDVDVRHIRAAFQTDPQTTTLRADHLDVEARGLPGHVDPYGTLAGQLRVPSVVKGEPIDASASFDGWIAQQHTSLSASIGGKDVHAHLDVPHIDSASLRANDPSVPLSDSGSIHVEAAGNLPHVGVRAHAAVGTGTVDLDAQGNVGDAVTVEATVTAAGIDLHSFAPVDHSDLAATVKAKATTAGGIVTGQVTLDSPAGRFARQPIPPLHLQGRFTRNTIAGTTRIEEAGAPAVVDFNLHPIHGPASASVLDFDARTDVPELANVPRLAHLASGQAQLRARGRLVLAESRVLADVQAGVTQIRASKGEVCIDAGEVAATVQGPLSAPQLSAHLQGNGLEVADYAFKSFDVQAAGETGFSHVVASFVGENTPDIHVEADVHPGTETTIHNVALGLRRKDVTMMTHIGRVRIGNGITSVEHVRVDGLGKLPIEGSVKVGRGSIALRAKGADLNLGKVGRLLKVEDRLQEGHVAFDIDVTSTRHDARGSVTLDLFGGKFPHANGASGRFQASFDGRHLSTELRGAVGELGWATVVADDVTLGGGLLEAASWRSATGNLSIDTNLDLAKLASAFPAGEAPVDEASGRVHLQAKVGRQHAGDVPDVDADISSVGLAFAVKGHPIKNPDGTEVVADPPFQAHGVDFELATQLKGKTNETAIAARLFDRKGALVQINASGSPHYAHLWNHASEAAGELANLPIKVDVIVPKRSLSDFPDFAKIDSVRGAIEMAVKVEGTALAPHMDARARGSALEASGAAHGKAVNVDLQATYDAKKAVLTLKAARPEGFVVEADAEANMRFADLVEGTGGPPLAWDAHATAQFHAFPVDLIPVLAERRIHGDLSGRIRLDGLHQDAKADVQLTLANLGVGRAEYNAATMTAHAENGEATAAVRLDQKDGFAETRASAGFAWGRELVPSLDPHKPIEVSLKAQAFRAAIAKPFLVGTVNDLDGRIDADTKLTYDLSKNNGKVVGGINVRDATFEVPNAGGEFHAVRARISMDPFGTVHVNDLSANGATGRFSASATVKLDGLHLRSADAKVHIDKDQKLPIEVEGVPMGDAWGDVAVKAQASADGKTITANIDLPMLEVDLPQSTGHSVQPLDPNPGVRAVIHEKDGAPAIVSLVKPEKPRPPGSSHLHVAIHFGNDVWVKRDTTMKLQLHGGPVIDVTDKARVSGQIVAGAGTIEVQSKKFEVEHATVSFAGDDPGNPQIVATAHWDAPSKTRVFVDVSGTPKDLKIKFRSEPDQLPQDAILSLILFGDENGSPGAAQSSASADDEDVNAAAGVGGGVVTQGLNKAIAGVTNVDITTRVDTSESRNPRPELAVQVTRDVSAAIAYNLGIPPPGQNPDRTQLILDYRFIRNWSLLTTLGDSGSSIVDLLWQYRY